MITKVYIELCARGMENKKGDDCLIEQKNIKEPQYVLDLVLTNQKDARRRKGLQFLLINISTNNMHIVLMLC